MHLQGNRPKLYYTGMDKMNKYMGFYELKAISLPTVPWQLFTSDTVLDDSLLWTVRVAVECCKDLNLPRAVGVCADEAVKKGRALLDEYLGKGIVIYYPYFIAQKSGVMDLNCQRTVIEAVDKDLWNLVTHGRKNVTAVFPQAREASGDKVQYFGDEAFLSRDEFEELLKYGAIIRGRYREELSEGKSIITEWSYAYSTDTRHEAIGDRYLVFYELRGI